MTSAGLSGKRIVITRPRGQAAGLARRLERAGARVVLAPMIRISAPSSYRGLDRALRALSSYDCVVFTSLNAVDRFFERARTLKLGRLPPPRKLYAIGPKTAARLKRWRWPKASLPKTSRGEGLAKAIAPEPGARVLVPRAQKAREALADLLRRDGARVDVVEAYRTLGDRRSARRLRRLADAGAIDAVTFTSASTVEHFVSQLQPARCRRLFRTAAAASIGPVTTAALKDHGIAALVQARRPSEDSLLNSLARHFAREGRA